MRNRFKRACASALCLSAVLAASTANASQVPAPTPGDYSLTVYDPSGNVVYQVEQAAATINPGTIYELPYADTSVTVGATTYLLANLNIFNTGEYESPNALPTEVYAATGNPSSGPADAIFGLVYDSTTETAVGSKINYYLAFAAGPPGTGTSVSPGSAGTYYSEATGPYFSATQYLDPELVTLGYTAYFYDPASVVVPEPSSLTLLTAGGAVLALAGLRHMKKSRAKIA